MLCAGVFPGRGESGEQRVKRADSAPCARLDFGGGKDAGIGAHLMREELTKGGKDSGKMPVRHRRRAPKKAVSEIRLATLPFYPLYRRGRASPVRGDSNISRRKGMNAKHAPKRTVTCWTNHWQVSFLRF